MISSKDFTLGVVGVGRVGLPIATMFALAGVKRVIGVDVNKELIYSLGGCKIPFEERGLHDALQAAVRTGNIHFTTEERELVECDVTVVCVGTPLTADMRPQLAPLMSAFESVLRNTKKGSSTLIVIRSTVPPGTTKDILEPLALSRAGELTRVVYSPERITENNALSELASLPEIVGSTDAEVRECYTALFRFLNPKKIFSYTDSTSAELAKIFCNMYRYANFALANEFALIAEEVGCDAHEVISIANESYNRGSISRPGPAGGPCLYKDGFFLDTSTGYTGLLRGVWNINEYVPVHVVSRLKQFLKSLYRVRVGVLGMSYKPSSDDIRYSPAMRLIELLKDQGAQVDFHDPHVTGCSDIQNVLQSTVVILAVAHPEFDKIPQALGQETKVFYDCCGFFRSQRATFQQSGIRYMLFGA